MADPSDDQSRTPEGVGTRLALTRRVYGLQQQEFAERAAINASAYNQYERGKRLISVSHAHRLCDVYDLTLDWVYRGDPSGLRYQTAEAIKALRKHGA
jgi:transcriptional regulator with XRE-family HTH domain